MHSATQKSRIAAYRRARPSPESLSDTQQYPVDDYVGPSHPVPMMRQDGGGATSTPGRAAARTSTSPPAGYATGQQRQAAAPDAVVGVGGQRNQNRFAQAFPPTSSVVTADPSSTAVGATSPLVGTGAPQHHHQQQQQRPHLNQAIPMQGVPSDLGQYIIQLEAQNQELRTALAQAQAGRPVSGGVGGERTEDEKRMFLNDVLSQVETVIQAHKNKTAAEVQKYKSEAENATLALHNLRDAIQQEGMDLSLAPAMLSFSRRSTAQGSVAGKSAAAAIAGPALSMPHESQELLDGISEEFLRKLLAVSTSEEVPNVVKQTTQSSFEAIVAHFTEQLCHNFEESDHIVSTLKSEVKSLQDDLRAQQTANENHKLHLVQQAEQETQALRDQLRAFQLAAANQDQVAAAVNERAMEEYTHMLIEARREANHLRQELETERNQCAQVCLRLKTSLQKRNNEFEGAVVGKAEEIVTEHQTRIAELEAELAQMRAAENRHFTDRSVQAGDPAVTLPTQENFVPNVMSAVKREAPTRANSSHSKEVFEQEVWRKTQELLQKFGSQS